MPVLLSTNQAAVLVGNLVSLTTGWNDDSVDAIIERIARTWTDYPCGERAVDHVIETHTGPARPSWAVLHDAYKAFIRRRNAETPALGTGDPRGLIGVPEGRRIAAAAYESVCRARPEDDPLVVAGFRKREPNPDFLAAFIGGRS